MMIKLTLLIQLCLIILFFDSIESPAPKKGGKKPQVKTRSILDDSQFKAGAKLGFNCRIMQVPMARSSKKPKKIIFESMMIIRYTKIVISGEGAFNLVCKRDTSTDSGDVVPPEKVEQEVKVDDSSGSDSSKDWGSGGGDGGSTEGGSGGGSDDKSTEAGGGGGGGDGTTGGADGEGGLCEGCQTPDTRLPAEDNPEQQGTIEMRKKKGAKKPAKKG